MADSRYQNRIVKPSGNYERLICYQKAVVVFDLTKHFTDKYLRMPDRTIDQMVQAARSGKQNIVEGIKDGETSRSIELNLLNVAQGSLCELKEDYRDYLRVHRQRIWESDSVEVKAMWRLGRAHADPGYFLGLAESRPPETVANMAICMIEQTAYFLHELIKSKEERFLREGGFKERMSAERRKERGY